MKRLSKWLSALCGPACGLRAGSSTHHHAFNRSQSIKPLIISEFRKMTVWKWPSPANCPGLSILI